MSDLLIAARIHRAYDVPRTDLIGHSDPYMKLSFQGQSVRTHTVNNTATPEWDQTLLITVPYDDAAPSGSLRVELWDEDTFKDELVATTQIPLTDILKHHRQGIELELDLAPGVTSAPAGKPKVLVTLGYILSYKGLKKRLSRTHHGVQSDDVKQRLYVPLSDLGPDVFAAVEYEGKEIDIKLLITRPQHSHHFELFFQGRPECKVKRKQHERPQAEGPLLVYEEIKVDDLSVMADLRQLFIQWGARRHIDRTTLDTITTRYGWKGRLNFAEAARTLQGVKVDHSTESIFMPDDGWTLVVDFDADGVDMKALVHDLPSNRGVAFDMGYKGPVVKKNADLYQPPRMLAGQAMSRRVELDDVPYGALFRDMYVDRYEVSGLQSRPLIDLLPLRG
jgi:hypothetical protein